MNEKLHKIGFITDDLCTFCKRESETLQHLFYDCSYSISCWKDFESYYLSLKHQKILNLKDILIGLLTPECPLLMYYLWEKLIFGRAEGMKNLQVFEVLNQKSNKSMILKNISV